MNWDSHTTNFKYKHIEKGTTNTCQAIPKKENMRKPEQDIEKAMQQQMKKIEKALTQTPYQNMRNYEKATTINWESHARN